MESSSRTRTKGRHPKRDPGSATPNFAASTPWPRIEQFLDAGEGTLCLGPINHGALGYTAVASDQHNMLVALVAHGGESLHQLLDRLEDALGPALDENVYVDEMNG
jgi:hypothetical protein